MLTCHINLINRLLEQTHRYRYIETDQQWHAKAILDFSIELVITSIIWYQIWYMSKTPSFSSIFI